MMDPQSKAPENDLKFAFSTGVSVECFAVPADTYIKNHPIITQDGIAVPLVGVSAYVIDAGTVHQQSPRMLLIQRAASDSLPNRWEVPGGACDAEDPSILYSCARELWEEAGLAATEIGLRVGEPLIFLTRSGRLICKIGFLVKTARATRNQGEEGQLRVKIDPKEHQNNVWASEEEVRSERMGDLELTFTSRDQKQTILQAFEIWKERGESGLKATAPGE
ncbi:hypothetical protein DV736_g6239, partial [Chaetothyriales sp. CBS 134916]